MHEERDVALPLVLPRTAPPEASAAPLLDPKKAEDHYSAGLEYYAKGSLQKAMDEWKEALKNDPEHEGAKSALRHAEEDKGNY